MKLYAIGNKDLEQKLNKFFDSVDTHVTNADKRKRLFQEAIDAQEDTPVHISKVMQGLTNKVKQNRAAHNAR